MINLSYKVISRSTSPKITWHQATGMASCLAIGSLLYTYFYSETPSDDLAALADPYTTSQISHKTDDPEASPEASLAVLKSLAFLMELPFQQSAIDRHLKRLSGNCLGLSKLMLKFGTNVTNLPEFIETLQSTMKDPLDDMGLRTIKNIEALSEQAYPNVERLDLPNTVVHRKQMPTLLKRLSPLETCLMTDRHHAIAFSKTNMKTVVVVDQNNLGEFKFISLRMAHKIMRKSFSNNLFSDMHFFIKCTKLPKLTHYQTKAYDESALLLYTKNSEPDKVKALLSSNVLDINTLFFLWHHRTTQFQSALVIATMNNDVVIVQTLLAHLEIDPNRKTNDASALMLASMKGHTSCVKLLLNDPRTNPNLKTKDGASALMYAAEKGHTGCVELLLNDPRTNPTLKTNDGASALMIALREGHPIIAQLLLNALQKTEAPLRPKEKGLRRTPKEKTMGQKKVLQDTPAIKHKRIKRMKKKGIHD